MEIITVKYENGESIPIELTRKNMKHIRMRVLSGGRVVLSAPLFYTRASIDAFIESHRDWLYRNHVERARRIGYIEMPFLPSDGRVYYLGVPRRLRTMSTLLDEVVVFPDEIIVRHKRGEERELEVASMFEDEIFIDRNPLLDSSDIISIEAIAINDLPGFYKLRLHLTPEGGKIWRKLSVEGRDDSPTLAFVIDDILYRTFKPRFLYKEEDNVVVDGPFDEPAALNLEANAIRNFLHFSQ